MSLVVEAVVQSRSRGMLFYRLVQQAAAMPHTLNRQIVGGNPASARQIRGKFVKGWKDPTRRLKREKAPDTIRRPPPKKDPDHQM